MPAPYTIGVIRKMPEAHSFTLKECGDTSVAAGRAPTQLGWYAFASLFVRDKTVLDVGCGLAQGLEILHRSASFVKGQDLDPRLAAPNVIIRPLREFADRSFDVVTCIDVIEHVREPLEFLTNLRRIACSVIFLTTPNWTAGRCMWPYHLREYTPRELVDLLTPLGILRLYRGTPDGSSVHRVFARSAYFLLNDLMTWRATAPWFKFAHKLLPPSCKIGSTLGALIELLPQ
jgi:SAM-dependent methyltransferase